MRLLSCWIVALFGLPLVTTAASSFEKLDLQDGSAITIDPTTDTGLATLTFTNRSGKSSQVSIHSGQVISSSSGVPVHGAKVLFGSEGGQAINEKYEPGDEMAQGQTVALSVAISGILDAGNYSVPLFNGSQPIGKLSITGFPFGVQADTLANGTVQVTVAADRSYFTLKNKDPVQYPITWELTAGTRKAAGKLDLRGSASQDVDITQANCGGSGNGPPSCLLTTGGWWPRFASLLKDSTEDGRLRIAYRPKTSIEASLVPQTQVAVKMVTHYRPADETSVFSSIILFVFLALGAILSIFANL